MSGENSGNGNTPLSHRHGGVLGLIGVVLGFPYDIPSWMPNVLVSIAAHSKDPAPIKVSFTLPSFFYLFFILFLKSCDGQFTM